MTVRLLLVLFVIQVAAAAQVPDLGTRRNGEDWPRFLGPEGDGKSSETGILKVWPPFGPRLIWDVPVGEGYSMVSISQGRAFLFDRTGDRARLRCLQSETGKELWRTEYDVEYSDYYNFSGGPRSSPVVEEDRVYTLGVEGRLRCHSVMDGSLVWEVDTAETFGVVQNFFGVGTTPVVEGELLIVMVGGSPPGSPRVHSGKVQGNGSGLVAFDKRTGQIRYSTSDELASYSTPRLTTIEGRRWGFLFARGGLIGFEPSSGEVEFTFPWRASRLESVNAATPVVVGKSVFITESYGPGGALVELGSGGFELIWKDPPRRGQSMASHWTTPIFHEGYLYGCSGRSSGSSEVRCIEYRTGKVAWSYRGFFWSTLIYADGHLIVLGEDGRLHLVEANPREFRLKASVTLKDSRNRPLLKKPAWNPPALSHGLLYVRGRDRLVCLELIPEP